MLKWKVNFGHKMRKKSMAKNGYKKWEKRDKKGQG